ncbi:MAG TPA: GNAT family N-acetyltransferase [Thermoleophilaceae bacterium]
MTYHDLHDDFDAGLAARFHEEVLAATFSRDELVSPESLAENLRAATALVTIALDEQGSVLGGIVGDWFAEPHVLLISYLAVRPGLRGQAIGTELRARAVATWPEQRPIHLVVAEVHDPRRWQSEEGEASLARLRLFERFGGQLLDVPFVQPALEPGTERVRGFLLLVFHVDDRIRAGGGEAVRAGPIATWIRQYYAMTEGAEPPYDPELAALLARVEASDSVRLMPLTAVTAA